MREAPKSKEAVILELLAEGDTMICLNARHQGVRVPPQHANDPALRLILNLNFPQPIEVTAAGISAKLSFGGRRMACYIPMEALWAAFDPHSKQGMMWPDSMPPEVLAELAAPQQESAPAEPVPPESADPSSPQPRPRLITGQDQPTSTAPDQGADSAAPGKDQEPGSGRRRGHLRVVK